MSVDNVNDDTPVLDRSNDSGIDQPTIENEVFFPRKSQKLIL